MKNLEDALHFLGNLIGLSSAGLSLETQTEKLVEMRELLKKAHAREEKYREVVVTLHKIVGEKKAARESVRAEFGATQEYSERDIRGARYTGEITSLRFAADLIEMVYIS